MLAEVRPIFAAGTRPALADVPAQLRALAADIEAGAYGDINDPEHVLRLVCVLRASNQEPAIMAYGKMPHVSQAYMDLHAGAAQLMAMKNPERT